MTGPQRTPRSQRETKPSRVGLGGVSAPSLPAGVRVPVGLSGSPCPPPPCMLPGPRGGRSGLALAVVGLVALLAALGVWIAGGGALLAPREEPIAVGSGDGPGTGAAETGIPGPGGPEAGDAPSGEPAPLPAGPRVSGRVVDASTRSPVTRYRIGVLPRGDGAARESLENPSALPAFEPLGGPGRMEAALRGVPRGIDVNAPDGAFELPAAWVPGGTLLVHAGGYALLLVGGDPFLPPGADPGAPFPPPQGAASPVFELRKDPGRILRVRDAATRLPIEGVEAHVPSSASGPARLPLGAAGTEIFATFEHPFETGTRTSREGTVSLATAFCGWVDRASRAFRSRPFPVPASLLLTAHGYAMKEWRDPGEEDARELETFLERASASLAVQVLDGWGRPIRAWVVLHWKGADPLGWLSDAGGRVTLSDLPVGEVTVTAWAAGVQEGGEGPGPMRAGAELPSPAKDERRVDESVTLADGIPARATVRLLCMPEPGPSREPETFLCVHVTGAEEIESLEVFLGDAGPSEGIEADPEGGAFRVPFPPGRKVRVRGRLVVRGRVGWALLDLGELRVEKGATRPIEIACPPAEPLAEVSGTLEFGVRGKGLFPRAARLSLVKPFGRTAIADQVLDNPDWGKSPESRVAFRVHLPIGRYRWSAVYLVPRSWSAVGSEHQLDLPLGELDVQADQSGLSLAMPRAMRLQIRVLDGPTGEELDDEQTNICLSRAGDFLRTSSRSPPEIVVPGSWSAFACARGHLPASRGFEAGGAEEVVRVEIRLDRGEAGVLGGTVLSKATQRPTAGWIVVRAVHERYGLVGDTGSLDGRFRITGLPAGAYVLEFTCEEGGAALRVTIGENERKEDLVAEVGP